MAAIDHRSSTGANSEDPMEQLAWRRLTAGVRDGAPVPRPCEEPERVDALRTEVDIAPFDAYVAEFVRD
ncbi:hypothetical protein ACFV0R_21285 [Streptomyces sp. NPDC059578]|uniref:hypothetical protein n=1 Tax=unclassified Streptomyces TaxID=2593676 RepID=UPI00365CB634